MSQGIKVLNVSPYEEPKSLKKSTYRMERLLQRQNKRQACWGYDAKGNQEKMLLAMVQNLKMHQELKNLILLPKL